MLDETGVFTDEFKLDDNYSVEGVSEPQVNESWNLQAELKASDRKEDATSDSLAFIRARLSSLELLSKQQERDLVARMGAACSSLALLLLLWKPSAKEVVQLVGAAVHIDLRKNMFSDESLYFSFRREVTDLAKANHRHNQLQALSREAEQYIDNCGPAPLALIELTLSIDWPGPLMLAMAERYSALRGRKTRTALAIDEYLKVQSKTPSMVEFPFDKHSAQIDYFFYSYVRARSVLVNHNLRLVFHIAKRYAQTSDYLADLIQEGTLGLIRAAEKFRASTGIRFSTYAHQWIESKVRKARINIDKVITVPADYNNKLIRIAKAITKHEKQGRKAEIMDISADLSASSKRVNYLLQLKNLVLSLDQVTSKADGLSLHSILPDRNFDLMQLLCDESLVSYVNTVMQKALMDRESYVLNERFGRLNSDPKTLQEISQILGVSRERVRQIEAQAISKLAKYLKDPC